MWINKSVEIDMIFDEYRKENKNKKIKNKKVFVSQCEELPRARLLV